MLKVNSTEPLSPSAKTKVKIRNLLIVKPFDTHYTWWRMERIAVPASANVQDGIVDIMWSGVFERGDVRNSLASVEKFLTSDKPVVILIRNQVRIFHFNASDAREVAYQLEELQQKGVARTCMLVDKPVHYGIGRMIHAFCEMAGVHFGIFWDEESALMWLRTGNPKEQQ